MNGVIKRVDGTGVAQVVELGFIPDFVKLTNEVTLTGLEYQSADATNEYGLTVGVDGTRAKADATTGVTVSDEKILIGASVAAASEGIVVEAGFYSM